MAPLRRYLRITKHSVLEVRIYLDRPADADTWLLKRDNPALPRVIQAIRPLVLPKLREENERVKGRGSARAKKKGVKDVVVEDDFEVSIFLTEPSSRHSVLTKQKIVKNKARIQSNSGKLTGWLTTGTSEQPVIINEDVVNTNTNVIREEEDDDAINLADIPEKENTLQRATRSQRTRKSPGNVISDVSSDSGASDVSVSGPTKQSKTTHHSGNIDQDGDNEEPQDNDNKKLRLNTSYDGFSIYGRILCLVVKRRGAINPVGSGANASQAMLENWVSTQAAAEQVDDDEDGG